jgi:hypothetical protein
MPTGSRSRRRVAMPLVTGNSLCSGQSHADTPKVLDGIDTQHGAPHRVQVMAAQQAFEFTLARGAELDIGHAPVASRTEWVKATNVSASGQLNAPATQSGRRLRPA